MYCAPESTVTSPDVEDTLRRVSVVFQQHICRGERTLRGLQRGDGIATLSTPRPEELVLKVKAATHVKKVAEERKRGASLTAKSFGRGRHRSCWHPRRWRFVTERRGAVLCRHRD